MTAQTPQQGAEMASDAKVNPSGHATQIPGYSHALEKATHGEPLGIASLVLGIVSLVSCLTGIGVVCGIVTAIIGLLLGAKARKILPPDERSMATAGFVCSIISLCLCGVMLLFVFGILGLMGVMSMTVI